MYRSVAEIIAASKEEEIKESAKSEEAIGGVCDAFRGFIDISIEWKRAADEAFGIRIEDVQRDLFAARAVSLGILTNKILLAAWELPKALLSGCVGSTMFNWRYITETKNLAMMIDMDIEGTKGFLWLHHKIIERAGVESLEDGMSGFADQAKQILKEAGFKYDKNDTDPWTRETNGRKSRNSVQQSGFVWNHRKFPPEMLDSLRSSLAEDEQVLLKLANKFAHPTLVSPDMVQQKVPRIIITAVQSAMSVMLAYKVAASDLLEWPYTETVGEQFLVYPPDEEQVRALSSMVFEMHGHCGEVILSHYLSETPEESASPASAAL